MTFNEKDSAFVKEVYLQESKELVEDLSNEGFGFFQHSDEVTDDEVEASIKKIRLKVDLRIIPVLCVTYTLQFLDKLSLNYAAAYSFKEDLNLTGQRYSRVASIFNFGYLFWAFPSNYIIQKVPIAKYTGFMILVWAVLLIAHIGAKNYGGILVLRFILGMFEAGISPSCMMICGMFYTHKEQPLRMCAFLSCNGIATILGALLGFGLGHSHNTSLASWKLIFLTFGLLNLAWSIVFLLITPDSPVSAKFLSERERIILIKHIAKNNQGVKDKSFKWYQVREVMCDAGVYVLLLFSIATGIINGGVSNFQSALIKGLGFSGLNASALQMPTGAIEFVLVLAAGILAFTIPNIRCLITFLLCVPGLAGLIGLHLIHNNQWASVGCTWLQYIVGGPLVMSWIFINSNIGGTTKKVVTNGAWFTIYAAGNIVGANIFMAKQAPRYISAMIGLMTCYSGMMAATIFYWFLLKHRNAQKTKKYGELTPELIEDAKLKGFQGYTDFENPGFRYTT